jgi:hypothetical protein
MNLTGVIVREILLQCTKRSHKVVAFVGAKVHGVTGCTRLYILYRGSHVLSHVYDHVHIRTHIIIHS